ncbi:MAG: hypothetical protein R3A11_03910 [Bdellovibrionota bacterium]
MKKSMVWAAVFGLVIQSNAWGSGISKPVNIGAKAVGMAGAFTAIADDPTAIFHNPAGIAQLGGHQFYLGVDSLITKLEYTPTGGTVENAKREFLPVPNFLIHNRYSWSRGRGIGGLLFPWKRQQILQCISDCHQSTGRSNLFDEIVPR